MHRFKFFVGYNNDMFDVETIPEPMIDVTQEEEFSESDPSWMWASEMGIEDVSTHELVSVECQGIREFLLRFPRYYIVPMVNISSNGIVHMNGDSENGWGFDIQNDIINFTYIRI